MSEKRNPGTTGKEADDRRLGDHFLFFCFFFSSSLVFARRVAATALATRWLLLSFELFWVLASGQCLLRATGGSVGSAVLYSDCGVSTNSLPPLLHSVFCTVRYLCIKTALNLPSPTLYRFLPSIAPPS